MSFAVLGTLELHVHNVVQLAGNLASTFAEHAIINDRPRLQALGMGLKDYKLDLFFHPLLGDAPAQLRALQDAQAAQQAGALVLGNGDYLGNFVITQIDQTPSRTLAGGTLLASSFSVTLREYVGEDLPPPAPGVQARSNIRAIAGGYLGVADLGIRNPVRTESAPHFLQFLAQGAALAQQAKGALGMAQKALAFAKALQSNPSAALAQLPAVVALAQSSLTGFSAGNAALSNLAAVLPDALSVAKAARDAFTAFSTVPALLSGANGVANIDAAIQKLDNGATVIDAARKPLARLAASAALRKASA